MKIIVLILLSIVTIVSCTNKNPLEKVVLKINNVEINEYMLHQKESQILSDHKSKKALKKFKSYFINYYYIIADAYSKRYDTITDLQKRLKYNSDVLIIQKDGYLWNLNEVPKLKACAQLTQEQIDKRSKLYYFDIINVNDKQKLYEVLNRDTVINTIQEFRQLKEKCPDYISLSNFTATLQWPFIQYFNQSEYLQSMPEKQISELLKVGDTYYYFYLDHIEPIQLNQDEKNKLIQELQTLKEQEIDKTIDEEMIQAGNPQINHDAVKTLMDYINSGNELRTYKGNPMVLSYTLDARSKEVNFKEFIEPSYYFPVFPVITTEDELTSALYQHYYNDYLSNKARKLGLYKNKQYLADCKMLMDEYIYYKYIEEEIEKKVIIDTLEVEKFYNNHQDIFSEPKTILVNCYFFDDANTALNNWYAIQDFYKNNSSEMIEESKYLYNLVYTLPSHKINSKECRDIEPNSLIILRNTPNGSVSQPILYRKKYALCYRIGDEGMYVKKLSDIYKNIENNIRSNKIDSCINVRCQELKKKYTLKVDRIRISDL